MGNNNEPIVMCVKNGESECCIAGNCPMFKQCFPEAYADWEKAVAKVKKKDEDENRCNAS